MERTACNGWSITWSNENFRWKKTKLIIQMESSELGLAYFWNALKQAWATRKPAARKNTSTGYPRKSKYTSGRWSLLNWWLICGTLNLRWPIIIQNADKTFRPLRQATEFLGGLMLVSDFQFLLKENDVMIWCLRFSSLWRVLKISKSVPAIASRRSTPSSNLKVNLTSIKCLEASAYVDLTTRNNQ